MSSLTRPGVSVNQVLTPLASSPTGVTGGSVAAFVAAYNIGPTRPTLVSNWQNYVNLFGGFNVANGSALAYAVWQFFANGGSSCYVLRVPNTDAIMSAATIGSVEPTQAALLAPATPAVTTATTGGTVLAGVYKVETTYTDSSGETTPSPPFTITTTGSTSTLVIASPAAQSGATGWNAYVTQVGGSVFTKQNSTPTAIATALTLTAPPTSSGANPPVSNTSGGTTPVTPALLNFTAISPGVWGNGLFVEIVPENGTGNDNTATFTLNVYQGGTAKTNLVESWPSVSLNPASTRNLLNLVNATNGGSNFVVAAASFGSGGYVAGTGASDPIGNAGTPLALTTGADGSTAPALDQVIQFGYSTPGGTTNPWTVQGLAGLSSIVLNVNLPVTASQQSTAQSVLNSVITWALGQGNVFVVVDAPFGGLPLVTSTSLAGSSTSPGLYGQYLSGGGAALDADSNVAVYGPWLSIQDPASATQNATRYVAPGGAVLGVWSRTDTNASVAQTPAGTTATVSAVSLEASFTASDLNQLETLQINPVKIVPGAGFCIFGGRTLATGFPNRYVNVSRTLLQFTTDFVNITQFAIFQNDDAALWQNITTVLTNYLTNAMQAGMLAGTTPETSFQVVCDSTTTTPAQAQAGIVNAMVAVALVSPAEFIIINLSQMQGGGTASVSS